LRESLMTKLRDEGLGELGTFEIEDEISIQDSHIVSRVASILRLVPCDSAAEHVLEDRSGTVRNVAHSLAALLPLPSISLMAAATTTHVEFLLGHLELRKSLVKDLERVSQRLWIEVSFFGRAFEFEPGLPFFETLESVAQRGVDVRVLFWDNLFDGLGGVSKSVFQMTPANRELCAQRMPSVHVMWDPSPTSAHCHHVKAFIFDDVSYVGGIIMSPGHCGLVSLVDPSSRIFRKTEAHPMIHDNFIRVEACDATLQHRRAFAGRWNGIPAAIRANRALPFDSMLTVEQVEQPVRASVLEHRGVPCDSIAFIATTMRELYHSPQQVAADVGACSRGNPLNQPACQQAR